MVDDSTRRAIRHRHRRMRFTHVLVTGMSCQHHHHQRTSLRALASTRPFGPPTQLWHAASHTHHNNDTPPSRVTKQRRHRQNHNFTLYPTAHVHRASSATWVCSRKDATSPTLDFKAALSCSTMDTLPPAPTEPVPATTPDPPMDADRMAVCKWKRQESKQEQDPNQVKQRRSAKLPATHPPCLRSAAKRTRTTQTTATRQKK